MLPGEVQLTKYAANGFDADVMNLMVSLSDSSQDWARRVLPPEVAGVPVRHLPWDELRVLARESRQRTRRRSERHWLTQLVTYLAGATAVRDPAEQWVYVVSVGAGKPDEGGPFTYRQFVREQRLYFHPFDRPWPRQPPVLMGFRWDGQLQQINRVEESRVVESLHEVIPEIPDTTSFGPRAMYKLGQDHPVPAGVKSTSTLRSRHVWALLDQLLTQPTIPDAERASRRLASR